MNFDKVGDVWVAPDCSSRCVCMGSKQVLCERRQCNESAQCDVKNGMRDCYCNDGFVGDGINCATGL